MRYVDLNKFMNKNLRATYAEALEQQRFEMFESEFKNNLNADYSINREMWDKLVGEKIYVVCLEPEDMYIANLLVNCYKKVNCIAEVTNKFLYQPEDKTLKLLACVEAEIWTVIEHVLAGKDDDMIDYLASKLKREYDLGNISEVQYLVLARGCGLFEDYITNQEEAGYDISKEAEYGFYLDMIGSFEDDY